MLRPFSYIHDITCSNCGKTFSINKVNTYCGDCRSPLQVNYDLDAVRKKLDRDEISQRQRGMWRWHELLPVRDHKNIVSLGEGDSALLHLSNLGAFLGLNNLFVKDESTNPSGSFKARGLSAAVSRARELGIRKLVIPTAGNAGGALAAYAARAGMEAHIFMPKDAPQANVMECRDRGCKCGAGGGLDQRRGRSCRGKSAPGRLVRCFDLQGTLSRGRQESDGVRTRRSIGLDIA